MELKELKEITGPEQSRKLKYKYDEFGLLIDLLRKRDLPAELVSSMNPYIEGINSLSASNKELLKQVRTAELRMLKLIEKEEKLVPKNHGFPCHWDTSWYGHWYCHWCRNG